MSRSLALNIKIDADGKASVAEIKRVERELDKLGPTTTRSSKSIGRMNGVLGALGRNLAAIASAGAIVAISRQMAQAADNVEQLRLQATKLSGTEAGFDQLYAKAQQLGMGLNDAAQAATNFATPLGKLGRDYQATLDFVGDLNQSMRLYGVAGQQANSVTLQLAQALNSGQLSGDELKSLTENAGPLAGLFEQAVQEITGSTESLKTLGSQGELTSQVVIQAFDQVFASLRDDFRSLPDTLEQQESRFSNAATRLFAALDAKLKSSEIWHFLVQGAADMLDSIAAQLEGAQLVTDPTALGDVRSQMAAINAELETYEASNRRLTGLEQQRYTALKAQLADLRASDPYLALVDAREKLIQLEETLTNVSGRGSAQRRAGIEAKIDAQRELILSLEDQVDASQAVAAATEQVTQGIKDTAAAAGAAAPIIEQYFSGQKALDGWAKTEKDLRREMARFVRDANAAGHKLVITSTWRSGTGSNHNAGDAVDVSLIGAVEKDWQALTNWWKANSHKYALEFPVPTERPGDQDGTTYGNGPHWHVELIEDTGKASASAAPKVAKLTAEQKAQAEAQQTLDRIMGDAISGVESLKQQYLPAVAAAEDFAAAQAHLALAGDAAGLSQAQQTRILEQMRAEMDAAGTNAEQSAGIFAEAWEDAAAGIDRNLSSLFADLLRDGKADLDSLKDWVIQWAANLAAGLAANPIKVVLSAVGLGGTSAAAASGTQGGLTGDPNTSVFGGGGLGGLGSLFGSNSLGLKMGQTFASIATDLGMMNATVAELAGNMTQVSNLAIGLGGAVGGFGSKLLFEFDSQAASIGNAIGSAAGTAIGTAIAPMLGPLAPLGPLIGSFLGGSGGGFLGGLFGDDEHMQLRAAITDGQIRLTHAQDIPGESFGKIQDAIDAINTGLLETAEALGPAATKGLREYQHAEMPLPAEDGEEIQRILEEKAAAMTRAMIDAMAAASADEHGAQYAELVGAVQQTAGGDLEQFLAGMAQLDATLEALTGTLDTLQGGEASTADAAEVLAAMGDRASESLPALKALVNAFGAQRSATEIVTEAFADLGLTIPMTADATRSLIAGLDLTTTEGLETATALGRIAPALKETQQQIAGLEDWARKIVGTDQEVAIDAINKQFVDLELGLRATSSTIDDVRGSLAKVILAGELSTTQMAALASAMPELEGLFDAAANASERAAEAASAAAEAAYEARMAAQQAREESRQALLQSITDIASAFTSAGKEIIRDLQGRDFGQQGAPYSYTDSQLSGVASLFDSLVVPEAASIEQIGESLTKLFSEWGLELPETRDALLALVQAGGLTADQIVALSGKTQMLARYYDELGTVTDDATAAIEQLYQDVLGRYADPAGLEYWVSQLQTGLLTLEQIGDAMEVGAQQRQFEIDLMRARGETQAALDAEREIALLGLETSLRPWQQSLWAIEDASADASSAVDALRESVDAEIASLQEAHDAQMDVLQERIGLEQQLAQALNETANLRQAELDALDASNRPLQTAIYALDDAGLAFDALERAIQEQTTAATETAEELRRISDALADAIDKFRAPQPYLGLSARSELSTMAALARTGGIMPDADRLERVLGDLQEPAAKDYRSEIELLRERAQIQSDLGDLAKVTDDQLSVEDRSLQALEDQLDEAKRRYNALIGIDDSVLSVEEATRRFDRAMQDANESLIGLNRQSLESLQNQIDLTQAQHEAELERLNSLVEDAQRQYDALIGVDASVQSVEAAVAAVASAIAELGSLAPPQPAPTTAVSPGPASAAPTSQVASLYQSMLGRDPDPAGLSYWESQVGGSGSLSTIIDDFRAGAIAAGEVPRFAAGGWHEGGWAMVGEQGPELAYMPPTHIYSHADSQSIVDTSSLEAEIRELRAEVKAQREQNQRLQHNMLREQQKTADLLERQERLGPKPTRETA